MSAPDGGEMMSPMPRRRRPRRRRPGGYVVGATAENIDLEGTEGLDVSHAGVDYGGQGLEGARDDGADMRRLGDLRLAFDPAECDDDVGGVDELDAGEGAAHVFQVDEGHADLGLRAHGHADAPRRAHRFRQRGLEQGHAVVARVGRRPGADVVDPGARHALGADLGDDGDRLSRARHD